MVSSQDQGRAKTGRLSRSGRALTVAFFALFFVLGSSVAVAQGDANPCEGPASAHNPNCDEQGQFRPPGRGLPEPEEPITLPNLVTIHAPSTAAGVYGATGANFGPAPTEEGVTGELALVSAASGIPSQGCDTLVGFPSGAIAVVDRGDCPFDIKVSIAQAAGAIAVIVVNHTDPAIGMAGDDLSITIPAVMVSLTDGSTIKAGLPATGTVRRNPG
jgi:hypothetical protein